MDFVSGKGFLFMGLQLRQQRWVALVALICVAALLVSACGETTDSSAGASSSDSSSEVSSTAATSGERATPTSAPATSDSTATPEETGTRTITTAYGEVEFPSAPERIVTFGDLPLDVSVALGVVPVGASASRGADGVAAYMQSHVGDITIIGTSAEPNLETIVQLEPHVILAEATLQQERYDSLSKIAPTFVPKIEEGQSRFDWVALTRAYAEVLGRTAEVDPLLTEVEEKIQTLAEQLRDQQGASVTVMRWMPQGPMVMNGNLITGQLLTKLGLTLPEFAMGIEGGHSDVLSLENLAEIDTDWLFIATLNADGQAALEAAREQPAFERLRANQADQVVTVNGQLWSSANGPLAAMAILDDIEQAMVK